jgi:hypothetical protein
VHPAIRIHARLLEDGPRCRAADPEDVRQTDLDALLTRQIDTRNASHDNSPRVGLALTLLMARILLADDANHTAPPDDLAVLADRLHARANLHRSLTPSKK